MRECNTGAWKLSRSLSERKLMDCLTRLGYDIEIKVRPAQAEIGQLVFAAA